MQVEKSQITNKALEHYINNLPDKEYKGISPSQLGKCFRTHYWHIKGVKPTTPPGFGAMVNFEVGRAWESFLADVYEKNNLLVKHFVDGEDEPMSDPETGLVGLPDFVLMIEGDMVVSDSKTVNSKFFRYAKRYKSFEDWVMERKSEIYQLGAYAVLLNANKWDIQGLHASFASKDDGFVGLEFRIAVTDQVLDIIRQRALRLKGYLDRDELPPCECKGWEVGYCNYGNPDTKTTSSTKKIINSECCDPSFVKEK